jgi:hypothetical protein
MIKSTEPFILDLRTNRSGDLRRDFVNELRVCLAVLLCAVISPIVPTVTPRNRARRVRCSARPISEYAPETGWPGALTFGLNATQSLHADWGDCALRKCGDFRPVGLLS